MFNFANEPRAKRLDMLVESFWCIYGLNNEHVNLNLSQSCIEWHFAQDKTVGPLWGFRGDGNSGFRGNENFLNIMSHELIAPEAVADFLFDSSRFNESESYGLYGSSSHWTLALCRIAFLYHMDSQSEDESRFFEGLMRTPGIGANNALIARANVHGAAIIQFANEMYQNTKASRNRMKFDHTTAALAF